MAQQTLYTLLATTLALSARLPVGVVDDAGTRTVYVGPSSGTIYLRILLAASGADASLNNPADLLLGLAQNLGAGWSVTLRSDGRVAIRFGGTTGTLDLSAAPWIYHALGWQSWAGAVDCTGAGVVAPYQPLGCVFLASREGDEDWKAQPGQQAFGERADGVVYGFHASDHLFTRTFRAAWLPRTPAVAAQLGASATPLYPSGDDDSRGRVVPALDPTGYAPPYSLHEFLVHCRGLRCGFAFGTLPRLLSGAETRFDVGFVRPETFGKKDPSGQQIRGVEQWYWRDDLSFTRTGRASLFTWSPLTPATPLLWAPVAGYNPSTGAWRNLGSGGDGAQPSSGFRPALGSNANGKPALAFDGSGDAILFPPACAPTGPFTVVFGVQLDATAGGYNYWLGSNGPNVGIVGAFNPPGTTQIQGAAVGAGTVFVNSGNVTLGVPATLAIWYDGTTLRTYLNGALIGSSTGTAPPYGSLVNLIVGNAAALSSGFHGEVVEPLIYGTAVGAYDLGQAIRWVGAANGQAL